MVHYVCPLSGDTFPLATPLAAHPRTGGHLNLSIGPGIGRRDIISGDRTLWRYRRALPLGDGPPVSLGEGATPLVRGSWRGLPIHFKLEFLAPTGSFKDRGTAVMITHLKQRGIGDIVEDSSGNAGASVAAYGAAAGMRSRIFVPASASPAKLVQIRAAGAEAVAIPGSRQAVTEATMAAAATVFYASHNLQPFFLEGTKTLAYELWEDLGFEAPDNVVMPVGGGSNLLGCHLGFSELLSRREIARPPRLFAVQAAACAPLVAAFNAGADDVDGVIPQPSIAEGIAIARPVRGREMLAALRRSGGRAIAVDEAAAVDALDRLARMGHFVEPTSAIAAAGLNHLMDEGVIGPGERTVLVLTGSGLKATGRIGELLAARPSAAVDIPPG